MNLGRRVLLLRNQRRLNHFTAKYLDKREANYAPLSPISLFKRTVALYPSNLAYVYGKTQRTWSAVGRRSSQFANALVESGVKRGEVVSIISPNTPAMYEAHFAVPGIQAVLHTINTRLDATTIAFQLKHCGAKICLVDTEFNELMLKVKQLLENQNVPVPRFINIIDDEAIAPTYDPHRLICDTEYEQFIAKGSETYPLVPCQDEYDAITLNYTSGTTGSPKGVVAHSRGAYLNAIGNAFEWSMTKHARFLWVVPMFHCNGWCFPWTVAAVAGTNYLCRQVRANVMFDLIDKYKIQYMAAAPVVMNTLLTYPQRRHVGHPLRMWTAGSPPAPSVIRQFSRELGIEVQTAYGLTESYGPISTHNVDPEWLAEGGPRALTDEQLCARQISQCRDAMVEDVRVMDPETMRDVPDDGHTLGEVMIKGNLVMKGYLGNEAATNECFEGGWFHTGDIAVSHGNGRFELKDRSKDIIISGGENISSTEIEFILMSHPSILEAAVVAMPDKKWDEVPCAYLVLKPDLPAAEQAALTEAALLLWCREHMPHYQAPKKVILMPELPKTTTGKVQKNRLRDEIRAWCKEQSN